MSPVPPTRLEEAAGPGRRIAIAGVAIGSVAVLAWVAAVVVLPQFWADRHSDRRMQSATQLRAITHGLVLYAQQNGDWLPEPGSDWKQRLLAMGVIPRDILRAPGALPGQRSYFFIPGRLSDFRSPQILVYTNPGLWQGRGGQVCYSDGYVEWIVGPAYQELFERLERERRARGG